MQIIFAHSPTGIICNKKQSNIAIFLLPPCKAAYILIIYLPYTSTAVFISSQLLYHVYIDFTINIIFQYSHIKCCLIIIFRKGYAITTCDLQLPSKKIKLLKTNINLRQHIQWTCSKFECKKDVVHN